MRRLEEHLSLELNRNLDQLEILAQRDVFGVPDDIVFLDGYRVPHPRLLLCDLLVCHDERIVLFSAMRLRLERRVPCRRLLPWPKSIRF